MNFWKRYGGDYIRDTAHLSLAEHGAYTLLLDHYYATRRPLPAALDALNRLLRATTKAEQEAVAKVVEEFFPINEDGLRHNKRADLELGKWNAQASANRAIAEARERKRHESLNESSDESCTNRLTIGSPTRNQKPEARNQKPETSASTRPSPSDEGSVGKPSRARRAIPDWLPADSWQAFEEHRKARRAPITDRAADLLIRKLDEERQRGHDPKAMLEQSIANGWSGVFPVQASAGISKQAQLEARNAEAARRWIANEEAKEALRAAE